MVRAVFVWLALMMAGGAVAQTPSWTYGEHPLWGLSASITVDHESIGLKCMPNRGLSAPAVALYVTKGLVRQPKNRTGPKPTDAIVNSKFIGAKGEGGGYLSLNPAGYHEQVGDTCEVSLDAFRKGRLLLLFDPEVDVMALGNGAENHPKVNDAFRKSFSGGKVMMTAGVDALPDMVKCGALHEVATFNGFNEDNDPHGEHDFGSFELCSRKFFWKIDCYDKELQFGSDDPADPEKTTRVLTLMLAEEY